jgi:hypothetical protein
MGGLLAEILSTSRIQVTLVTAWANFLNIKGEQGEKFRTLRNEELYDLCSRPVLLDGEMYEATTDWRVAKMENTKNVQTYRAVMEQFWKMSNCNSEKERME